MFRIHLSPIQKCLASSFDVVVSNVVTSITSFSKVRWHRQKFGAKVLADGKLSSCHFPDWWISYQCLHFKGLLYWGIFSLRAFYFGNYIKYLKGIFPSNVFLVICSLPISYQYHIVFCSSGLTTENVHGHFT